MNLHRTPFTLKQILAWADAHYERTGKWPGQLSGLIPKTGGENWRRVESALRLGLRGLPGGSSLAQLLKVERGVRNVRDLPGLSDEQILGWALAHRGQTGRWPKRNSGPVLVAPGENWRNVEMALRLGLRGLAGGRSLRQLLEERGVVPKRRSLVPLTEEQILKWADQYHRREGEWPHLRSGKIADAPEETWRAVDRALANGSRRLSGGSSLYKLLAARRAVRNRANLPYLRLKDILAWADEHHQRTGRWPTVRSGPIPEAIGETWRAVEMALINGFRGLQGGMSLARLLRRHGRARH